MLSNNVTGLSKTATFDYVIRWRHCIIKDGEIQFMLSNNVAILSNIVISHARCRHCIIKDGRVRFMLSNDATVLSKTTEFNLCYQITSLYYQRWQDSIIISPDPMSDVVTVLSKTAGFDLCYKMTSLYYQRRQDLIYVIKWRHCIIKDGGIQFMLSNNFTVLSKTTRLDV